MIRVYSSLPWSTDATARQPDTGFDGLFEFGRHSLGATRNYGVQQHHREVGLGAFIEGAPDNGSGGCGFRTGSARICGSAKHVGVSVSPKTVLHVDILQYRD